MARCSRLTLLGAVVTVAACTAARPLERAAPPPTRASAPGPTAAHADHPPIAPSLVAASNELAEALGRAEPMRSRGIERARTAIEAVTDGRATLVQERKLGHGACALGSTLLAIGTPDGVTTSPHGLFVRHGNQLLRFDPEPIPIAERVAAPGTDDSPDVDLTRFVWVDDGKRLLVDADANSVVAQADDGESVLFRSRSGRLRVLGVVDGASELRSVPGGKLLFRHPGTVPFADDVAGVAGAMGLPLQPVPPWLVVHDAADGRELRRHADVPSSIWPTRVAIAPDRGALALGLAWGVAWLEPGGRRTEPRLSDGSIGAGSPDGPHFTRDGKRACANLLGVPVLLPTDLPRKDHVVCAFTPRSALHSDATVVNVKPDPPWTVLRGPAVAMGNFPKVLGASAATADGQRAAFVEVAKPVQGWRGEARLRLVDAPTGATLRTWPIPEQGLIGLELRFVDGEAALLLYGSEDGERRFVIDEATPAPAPPPPPSEEASCRSPSWDPDREATCVIGPVLGPAALCAGARVE